MLESVGSISQNPYSSTAVDDPLTAMDAPDGVNGTLWALSSYGERQALLAESQRSATISEQPNDVVQNAAAADDIVITAPGDDMPPTGNPTTPGDAPDGAGGVGGSGADPGYKTPGASEEANKFSEEHVKNWSTSAEGMKDYLRVRDNIAKLYDYAKANPTAPFSIGNGKTMTFDGAMKALIKVKFMITASDAWSGPAGASANVSSDGKSVNIYVNSDNASIREYDRRFDGNTDEDYIMFHEIGHALNHFSPGGSVSSQESANTAGRSIQNALGLGLLSEKGTVIDPTFGYN